MLLVSNDRILPVNPTHLHSIGRVTPAPHPAASPVPFCPASHRRCALPWSAFVGPAPLCDDGPCVTLLPGLRVSLTGVAPHSHGVPRGDALASWYSVTCKSFRLVSTGGLWGPCLDNDVCGCCMFLSWLGYAPVRLLLPLLCSVSACVARSPRFPASAPRVSACSAATSFPSGSLCTTTDSQLGHSGSGIQGANMGMHSSAICAFKWWLVQRVAFFAKALSLNAQNFSSF
jgi:hypothetical protein